MKKSLKNRFKKWNIGDYVRQFSIVTGGVLLTLWLTAKIADSAKQREVRQAMQLVALELRQPASYTGLQMDVQRRETGRIPPEGA